MSHTSKSSSRKFGNLKIGISQGELTGISPEIIAKSLNKLHTDTTLEFYVVCTKEGKELISKHLDFTPQENIQFIFPDLSEVPSEYHVSEPLVCIYYAAKLALDKKIDAIVTAPIDKNVIAQKYSNFSGHTGFLREITNTENVLMLMSTPSLKVGIFTEHVPLSEVCKHIKKDRIIDSVKLLNDYIKSHSENPTIGVLAINPHAGDSGLIGTEENEIIAPAIKYLNENNIKSIGPLPGDTAFTPSHRKTCDAFLSMYHDQGMIPVKMKGLDLVVNISLGLPIIRTSPGHGVAYDIANKGIASPESMLRAIDEASTMALAKRFQ